MKKEVLISFALLVIFSSIVKVQTKGTIVKGAHKPKRWIRHIFHKPVKHHLNSQHKKHDVLTLAAPPSVGSLLPSTNTMTLMPNGVPNAAGEYIHHLMHHHPSNIPVYHGGYHPHGIYPIHTPEHFGPLGPFGHHRFYRHGPWPSLGYGVRYPYGHGFVSGPWYGPLPGHGFGYGYHRHFGHGYHRHFGHGLPWHGLLRHGPAGYEYGLGHAYRRGLGFGYGHGYRHGYGNWWFNPRRDWYPYAFDHSVDVRGDSGPETMFVERSSVPTSRKGSKAGGKFKKQRIVETGRKATITKRVHAFYPARRMRHRSSLRHKFIPFGFRIRRYKISLIPFKGKLKHSHAFKKFQKSIEKLHKMSLKISHKTSPKTSHKMSLKKSHKKSIKKTNAKSS